MPMRYVLYARKSSEAKEKQVASISDQIAECEKYAQAFELSITHKLQEAKSAFRPYNREQFDVMLELFRSKQADAVLTWKPDRLCRNPTEGGILLQMLQDGIIKEIRTATGETYTQESDHLVLQLLFGMANSYSRVLSQNVKRAMRHKCERGEYFRQAPLGYEGYGVKGARNIRPHPKDALKIKQLFEKAAEGKSSLATLSMYANDIHLRTKGGKPLAISHINKILTSQTYMGYFLYKGELFEGNYEPIISGVLFERVQSVLRGKTRPRTAVGGLLNGVFVCSECGCSITTSIIRRPRKTMPDRFYTYHHCSKRRGKCDQKYINHEDMVAQIEKYLLRISEDTEALNLAIELLREKYKHQVERTKHRRLSYQRNYNLVQSKLDTLTDMRLGGEIDREEYLLKKQELLKERTRLNSLLSDDEDGSNHWLEYAEQFADTVASAKDIALEGTLEEKRDLLVYVSSNCFVKNGKLDITLKKPYSMLPSTQDHTLWRPLEDSNP
jgi:site-specific DNA recombinase